LNTLLKLNSIQRHIAESNKEKEGEKRRRGDGKEWTSNMDKETKRF